MILSLARQRLTNCSAVYYRQNNISGRNPRALNPVALYLTETRTDSVLLLTHCVQCVTLCQQMADSGIANWRDNNIRRAPHESEASLQL